MSVYKLENKDYFDEAIKSVLYQTTPTNDIVIVCDGELGDDLNKLINYYDNKYPNLFNIIRKPTNTGFGDALSIGLPFCKNELVMRCDTDDICFPKRAEKQIKAMITNNLDVLSTPVFLFTDNIDNIVGYRDVPKTQKEIVKFSKHRSPFNHPAVMFKKSFILLVGNYSNMRHFQDYELWVRCLQNNAKCLNLNEPLVYMRSSRQQLKRRKNRIAYDASIQFFKYMRKTKYTTFFQYLHNRIGAAIKYYSPAFILKLIYAVLHRKRRH